jgi:hypothetical protein
MTSSESQQLALTIPRPPIIDISEIENQGIARMVGMGKCVLAQIRVSALAGHVVLNKIFYKIS